MTKTQRVRKGAGKEQRWTPNNMYTLTLARMSELLQAVMTFVHKST
jgi:hypothetical protein